LFDEALVKKLAPHAEQAGAGGGAQIDALEDCLDKLGAEQRELIAARYTYGETVKEMAQRLSKPARTLATKLFRLRNVLLDCINRKLAAEDVR